MPREGVSIRGAVEVVLPVPIRQADLKTRKRLWYHPLFSVISEPASHRRCGLTADTHPSL
jgi:hypothetical protein